MKRILIGFIAALCSSPLFASTPSPVSLLNTAGSTAGQAIVSPGPAGHAGWGNVSAAALTGITPALNGGTGVTTAAAELSRIGAAPLAGASFTGPVSLSYSGPIFTLNDTSGTSKASLLFNKNGVTAWGWGNSSTPNALAVDRYASGSYADSPISVANATGVTTFTIRPIFNGATPYDTSNLTIANYLTTAAAATTYAPINATSMTSYSPVVTATSGTFTTASATGAYYVVGKLVFFEVAVTVTTVGTATGNAIVTLPFAANTSGGTQVFNGMERAITGKTLQGFVSANSTSMTIRNYDQSGVIAAGTLLVLSGVYVSN